jgi:hypothetical protein
LAIAEPRRFDQCSAVSDHPGNLPSFIMLTFNQSHSTHHRRRPRHRQGHRGDPRPPGRHGHLRVEVRGILRRGPRRPSTAGGRAKALAVDVADGAAIAKAVEELLQGVPAIDILVNNAGITRDGLLFRMSEADWNDVITTNLTSCFHWTKLLARPMTRARWGRIVNITSVSGMMGNAGQANYSAAKAGMIGLTKTLAREFAAQRDRQRGGARLHQDRHDHEFVNNPEAATPKFSRPCRSSVSASRRYRESHRLSLFRAGRLHHGTGF